MVDLDKILVEEVGQCGRYQILVIALCGLIALLQGFAANDYVFTFGRVNTRCVIPECENTSYSHYNFTSPWILNALPHSHNSFDNCHRYANKTSNTTDTCPVDIFNRSSIIVCEEYVYEDKNSAIYEFNMACDHWRPHFLGSVNILGMMVSLPLTGFVSDRRGRRVAIFISVLNFAFFGCLKYFASSYISYLLISLVQNVTGACAFTSVYILALEYVGSEYRVATSATISTFLSLGGTLLGLLAWSRPFWRNMLLIMNAPLFITVSYFWIIPESFRWLMSKGRIEEAGKVLKKAAKTNGNVLSAKTLQSFSKINEIPGFLAAALLLNRIGRKPLLIAGYWICGACQIAYILIPDGHYWLSLPVYLVGKLAISAVMTTIYVYTAELYPTYYRSTLLGYSSMVGRLGAILGPLTPALSNAIWRPLPFVLFAGMAFLCGVLVTLAPETLGCALPDSMQDAENLGKDKRSILHPLRLVFKKKCYTIQ